MSDEWTSGIGSEFGEVDNPAYGQKVANWNVGAWGDKISGWSTEGVALPNATPGEVVEVRNPETGQTVLAPTKDTGPASWTGADIDLLAGTRSALGLPRDYKGPVEFRMVSGAPEGFAFKLNHEKSGLDPIGSDTLKKDFLSKSDKYSSNPDGYWDKFQKRYPTTLEQFKALNPEYSKANPEKLARALQSKYYPDQTVDEVRNRLQPNNFAEYIYHSIDNLRDSLSNLWQNAVQSANQLELGAQQAKEYQPPGPNDPFQLAMRDVEWDSSLDDSQKQMEIDALREQQQRDLSQNRAMIPQTEAAITQAQADKPGPKFQDSWQGHATTFIGQSLPYLASGLAGPMGTFSAATQMTAAKYGEMFDQATARLKELHPEMSDTERLVKANQTATESSKAAGVAGLGLALTDVPVAGPMIARMVARDGIAAATFSLANVYAKVHENMAMKKNVDPKTSVTEGLLQAAGVGAMGGVMFGLPGALGEALRPPKIDPHMDAILPEEPKGRSAQDMAPFKGAIMEEHGDPVEKPRVRVRTVSRKVEPSVAATNGDDIVGEESAHFYSGLPMPSREQMEAAGQVMRRIYSQLKDWVVSERTVLASLPHTEELVRAIDKFRPTETADVGKAAQLSHLYKELRKSNPNLSKEIDSIGRTIESGHPVSPNISQQAKDWLAAANNGLYRHFGDRMRKGGFLVTLPDGSTRDFIGAPEGVVPFPRIMRPDVIEILGHPMVDSAGKLTESAQKLYDEGRNTIDLNTGKPYFETPDDLLELAREHRSFRERMGPVRSNLEMARTLQYPSFFYTYSPESMLGLLRTQALEIARLEAFGQKLQSKPDLFDTTLEAIRNDLTLDRETAQYANLVISDTRKDIYGTNTRPASTRFFRGFSSFSLAGSVHTSSKIAENMMFNNPAYFGLFRSLRAMAGKGLHPHKTQNQLRELGLSNDILINIHNDPYAVTTAQQHASNFFTGGLRVAGHAMAQDIGKGVTMRASRLWIASAIRKLQKDPNFKSSKSREMAEFIAKRGLDPREFTKANVPKELEDKFVIECTNDLQTAYRPEDYPRWANKPTGALMFQFGHWSYNAARLLIRDTIMPFGKAVRSGDAPLAGRYFLRLMGAAMAAAGASEAWRQADKLFGRQSDVASAGEMINALAKHDPVAMHLLTHRLVQDVVGSSVVGTFGDLWNVGDSLLRGSADRAHFFNPFQPAVVGWLSLFALNFNNFARQGGRLSDRQWADFRNGLLGIVGGYYDLANTLGVPLPGHQEAMGRRRVNWVRSRLNVFYDAHPEFDKRQNGYNAAGNSHTAYLQNINEAIVSGQPEKAIEQVMQMQRDLNLSPKELKASVGSSIRNHLPVPGGKAGPAFRKWMEDIMPEDERKAITQIDQEYRANAKQVLDSLP